ncbi:serine hydrolase [Solwaraspora sp. WMMD406]|uniref:serine hydrolase n=1 Tax=Solwaraspora sp. WMMD406 TaxID=3016095 RepID=UPI0024163C94|nr:serine hydrolase [Solwaraspora sp. WMMD406]MDG4766347.1 serine hydrolase [Solwaraspora sp. WMMD406]
MLSLGALGLLAAGAAGYGWSRYGGLSVPESATGTGQRVAAGVAPGREVPGPSPETVDDAVARQRARAVRAAEQVRRYTAGAAGQLSVAVVDQPTGAGFLIGADQVFQTASIVKVDILSALLLHMGGSALGADRRRLATRMITVSDNSAASELFASIGGVSGLRSANDEFGMTETRPRSAWGTTTTTAADQIRLLRTLTTADGPLSQADRDFVLELMSGVVSEQRWGVTAGAGSSRSKVWVKNGWVTIDEHAGRWLVNSIGRIVEEDNDWLVAVLSDHHDTLGQGVEMVERVSLAAFRAWRTG